MLNLVEKRKDKQYYISKAAVGNIVAFIVVHNKEKLMLSGRIKSITKEYYTIVTKNGSVFFVKPQEIVWVKTGSYWPIGIYNALRYKGGVR